MPEPTALDFSADVLEASRSRPIVVDFWAPWCGPCRALGPTLETLDREAGDRWTLVKVNTDEHPELRERYGVRGIPAVKLFVDGAAVAEFTGALPERKVRQWLEQSIPVPARQAAQAAHSALEAGDRASARAALEDVLPELGDETAPWAVTAKTDLARLIVLETSEGDGGANVTRARALVDGVHTTEADVVRIVADAIERDLPSLPDGSGQAVMRSALEAVQSGDIDAALGSLIEAVQIDRSYDDDGARKLAIALFLTLGEADPIVKAHRPVFNRSLY